MRTFLLWKFVHIASMFISVTLLFAYDIMIHRSAARGDVAERDGGDGRSQEFAARVKDPRSHLSWVSAFLYAAVIYVMVFKPFS